jgi:2-polyprenyl-3-methyl-5-hydroxy-6-metoxy-1,4-benzoquinol methylase
MSEKGLYLGVIRHEVPRRVARRLRLAPPVPSRTPARVIQEYEERRTAFLSQFAASEWDVNEFALREADDHAAGPQVFYGRFTTDLEAYFQVQRAVLGFLESAVKNYEPETLLEVGCGTGRHLLWLLSRGVGKVGVGLELTKSGVAVASLAAERYGLEAEFRCFDVTSGDWEQVPRVDVVFSVAAIEQIPDARGLLRTMQAKARKAIVMIEPFPEYWKGGLGAIANRLRNHPSDRLRRGSLRGKHVVRGGLLPVGSALNRPSLVIIEP